MSKNTKIFIGVAAVALLVIGYISFKNPLTPAKEKDTGYVTMYTQGYSMSGYYQRVQGIPIPDSTKFDIIVDTHFPISKLKKGDPVVYRNRYWNMGERNTLHHLVWEISPSGKAFMAKGYYNSTNDGVWVEDVDYIGKATHIWYNGEAVKLK